MLSLLLFHVEFIGATEDQWLVQSHSQDMVEAVLDINLGLVILCSCQVHEEGGSRPQSP